MGQQYLPDVWFETEDDKKEFVGAGSYGSVYKVTDKEGNVSAVKIIEIPGNESEVKSLQKEFGDSSRVRTYLSDITNEFMVEIRTLEKLKYSNNIVKLISHYVEEKEDGCSFRVYIQMEYLQTLSEYYQDKELSEADVINLGIDICNALIDCEKKNIIHRDIKPDNIMVDKNGTFKLGDFGIARHIEKTFSTLSMKGTALYMAPEIYHGARYGKNVDIYSLGLVMHHLLNENVDPFIDINKEQIFYKDKEAAVNKRMNGTPIPAPAHGSKELCEIIAKAIAFKPKDRYLDANALMWDLFDLRRGEYKLGKSWNEIREEDAYVMTPPPLPETVPQKETIPVSATADFEGENTPKNHFWMKIIFAEVACLMVITLVGCLFLIKKGKKDSDQKAQAVTEVTENEKKEADIDTGVEEATLPQETESQAYLNASACANMAESAIGEYGDHYYLIFDRMDLDLHSFLDVEMFCEQHGGHLAVIESQEENTAIYNFLRGTTVNGKNLVTAFFGYTDMYGEGNWLWVNNSTSTYENWCRRDGMKQPNNGSNSPDKTPENYAMFFTDTMDGTWNDSEFDENSTRFICEFE